MECKHHHTCQEKAMQNAEKICEDAGARFTDPRRHVLQALWNSHKVMTAKEVMHAIGNNQPPITYRALDFLTEVGLIHHVHSLNAYIGCTHALDQKHASQLLVCTTCKDVQEIQVEPLNERFLAQAQAQKFTPQNVYMEMLGTCKTCQEAQA